MKIRFLGHSCFVLKSSAGTTVVTDPYGGIGFAMPSVSADVVTVSHHHFDHDNASAVSGAAVLDREGTYEVGGVKITAIKSWHDDAQGKKRGPNLIFKYEMDGLTVCHLGDLGEECSAHLIGQISPVDVLLIPVGGVYTIDATQAKAYVGQLKPSVVIPMHFREQGKTVGIGEIEDFLKGFDPHLIEKVGCEAELSRETIAEKNGKIIVMERQK